MVPVMPYRYQPLQCPLSIRLLTLNPQKDFVSVQVHTVDLDSASCPPYWALSYTWGSPVPSRSPLASQSTQHEILCDGQPLLVGENLYAFLKRFSGNRYYWIDAICINQDDLAERSTQVGIMAKIYTHAEGTFLWLGEQDATSERAFTMITNFANARFRLGKEYGEKVSRRPWKVGDSTIFDTLGIEAWSEEDWKALSDFYARPWFRRQWVVQEVTLAKQVVIFCGSRGMDWLHFISLTQLYLESDWHEGLISLESEFHKAGTPATIQATTDFLRLKNTKTDGPAFHELLLAVVSGFENASQRFHAFLLYTVHKLRGRDATLLVDHVYAPRSLASRWMTDEDSLPPVDYSLSVIEAYTEFSAHLLRVPRPMVLAFREDDTDRRLKDLPSWVPDYSVAGTVGEPLGMKKAYNACGTHFPRLEDKTYVVIDKRLHLRGVFLDTISEITDQIHRHASAASLFDLIRLAFYQDSFLTGHDRLESLMRTVCGGIVEEHTTFPRDDIFAWFARWYRLVSQNPSELARFREAVGDVDQKDWETFWTFDPGFLHDQSLLSPPSEEETRDAAGVETWCDSPELTKFLRVFIPSYRRLALTRSRRALALTMLSARLGDEVWILFNGRTPYILRKIEGEEHGYRFVGETYVHGFMQGEVFSRDKVDGIDVKIVPVVLI